MDHNHVRTKFPNFGLQANSVKSAHILELWRELQIEVVRVVDEWSTEFGHHVIDGADIHDHPPLLVPRYRREGRLCDR